MNCGDVHLSLGAEPGVSSPELEAHLRECAACAQFHREMLQLDEEIRRALTTEVPRLESESRETVPAPVVAASKYSPARQWALAASLFLAVGAVLVMWGVLPRHSLAADVVSHVLGEPFEQPLDHAVDNSMVREVMERSGLQLDPIDTEIVFVRTCLLRGRLVPHFVVRTEHGMATVMVLPDERLKAPEPFSGNGYKGVLIPAAEKGAIAVLSRSDVEMERYAREIRRAVHALPRRKPVERDAASSSES